MKVEKISVSLPRETARFIEEYRKSMSLKTRSEVVARAIALLRARGLEDEYRSAAREDRQQGYTQEWNPAAADGLDDEAW